MPVAVKSRFERAVDARKQSLEQEREMTLVPQAQRAYKENLAWMDLIKDAFLAARIDEKSRNIEIRAKIRTRLDE